MVAKELCSHNGYAFYHPPTELREGTVFVSRLPMLPLSMMHWTSLYRAPTPGTSPPPPLTHQKWDPQPLWTSHMGPRALQLVTSGSHHWRPVKTYSLEDPPPPVLTSSGHRSTYDWQASSTHLTEILSCF